MVNVHAEMMLQVCRLYSGGLPDVRTLRLSEIRFFYEGLRKELREGTSPKNKPKAPPRVSRARRRR